jgi:hypothetical protein
MENTKTTLTNLDTIIEAIVELDSDGYKLTINKPYTHIRHKDRNVLLQKAPCPRYDPVGRVRLGVAARTLGGKRTWP